jgi:hypothetical protein
LWKKGHLQRMPSSISGIQMDQMSKDQMPKDQMEMDQMPQVELGFVEPLETLDDEIYSGDPFDMPHKVGGKPV